MSNTKRNRWLISLAMMIFLAAMMTGTLMFGCRAIPCSSVETLAMSFDVFWEDHTDMLQRDETLTTEDKQVVLEHALSHKKLIQELEKLCAGE